MRERSNECKQGGLQQMRTGVQQMRTGGATDADRGCNECGCAMNASMQRMQTGCNGCERGATNADGGQQMWAGVQQMQMGCNECDGDEVICV